MLLILLLAGCDRVEVAESWQIDRLRVLAVAGEPAEPRPGDTVRFSSLVVSPNTAVALTTWFACLPESADATACAVDTSVLDGLNPDTFDELTPEEQAALFQKLLDAGLIGAEPYLSPVWTVPGDALDGLTEAEKLEGTNALVSVTALPEADDNGDGVVDEADIESAYKRIPVSLAATPNHNPSITGFLVDGAHWDGVTPLAVTPGQTYRVAAVLGPGAVEGYQYTTDDGTVEDRVEEPYFSWYAQEGGYDTVNTLYPTLEVSWTAPADSQRPEQSLWVVMRDRRGGMAWAELPLILGG